MDEYTKIKEKIISILENQGKFGVKDFILNAIVYEFYTLKEDYEYTYDIPLSEENIEYKKIMNLAINTTLQRNNHMQTYKTEKEEDSYLEETISELEETPHIIHILDEDEEIDKNIVSMLIEGCSKNIEYEMKEDILKAFKLLLKEYNIINNHPVIQQYLKLSEEIYTQEDIEEKNFLLISTLLFKLNFFYKNKLDKIMEYDFETEEYNEIDMSKIIYLNQNNQPIYLDDDGQGNIDNTPHCIYDYAILAHSGNASIFSEEKENFYPAIFCRNIRNAFAHHAWKFSNDGRIYFYHINQSTGQKDFNIAIDIGNLEATIYAILKTCLKEKFIAYFKHYGYIYDDDGVDISLKDEQKYIKEVVDEFEKTQIISKEEISNILDKDTMKYDIYKLKECLNTKLDNLLFIKMLAEYIDDQFFIKENNTCTFTFYNITSPKYEHDNLPEKVRHKYLSDAIIVTILNTFFVHLNLDAITINSLDFSSIIPSQKYIEIIEKQRDEQILKHEIVIANAQSDLKTYKNIPKKVANLNKKIEREQNNIEIIKQTFENKKNMKNTENVFNHIRNSIAHGNIEIINDGRKIVIKDYETRNDKQEITFEGEIETNKLLEIIIKPLIEKEKLKNEYLSKQDEAQMHL